MLFKQVVDVTDLELSDSTEVFLSFRRGIFTAIESFHLIIQLSSELKIELTNSSCHCLGKRHGSRLIFYTVADVTGRDV